MNTKNVNEVLKDCIGDIIYYATADGTADSENTARFALRRKFNVKITNLPEEFVYKKLVALSYAKATEILVSKAEEDDAYSAVSAMLALDEIYMRMTSIDDIHNIDELSHVSTRCHNLEKEILSMLKIL